MSVAISAETTEHTQKDKHDAAFDVAPYVGDSDSEEMMGEKRMCIISIICYHTL